MTFETRDKLSKLFVDDVTAFGIAQEFVQDDEHKFAVYERCYKRMAQVGNVPQTASNAKDEAQVLWDTVYAETA